MLQKWRTSNERRREFRTHLWNVLAFYPGGWKAIIAAYPAIQKAHKDPDFASYSPARLAYMSARKILNDFLEAQPNDERQKIVDELVGMDWAMMRNWAADLLEDKQKDMLPQYKWATVVTATAFVVVESMCRQGYIEITEMNEFQTEAMYAARGIDEKERSNLLIRDALDEALGLNQ